MQLPAFTSGLISFRKVLKKNMKRDISGTATEMTGGVCVSVQLLASLHIQSCWSDWDRVFAAVSGAPLVLLGHSGSGGNAPNVANN